MSTRYRAPRVRALELETLEERCVLAGNVTAAIVGYDLVITGNDLSNQIAIVDNGSGVDVFGSEDTKINGELDGVASFGRVYGDLRISMKRGDDIVFIADVGNATYAEADGQDGEVLGRIKIWGGYGRDTLAIIALDDSSPILYGLSVYAGPGADCVYVYGVDTYNSPDNFDLFIGLGSGDDTLVMTSDGYTETWVGGNSLIDAGTGNDKVKIEDHLFTTPDAYTNVVMGSGHDQLAVIDSEFRGNLLVYGQRGADVIGIFDSTIHGNTRVYGSAGRDKFIARASTFGTDQDNLFRIFGGSGRDWFAFLEGNQVNASARVIGGPQFDNGYDDGSNTIDGPWRFVADGVRPHPLLDSLIDQLLAIDCEAPAGL